MLAGQPFQHVHASGLELDRRFGQHRSHRAGDEDFAGACERGDAAAGCQKDKVEIPESWCDSSAWSPMRTSMPISLSWSLMAQAHRSPSLGRSNFARKPSFDVSSSVPENLTSSRRINSSWEDRTSRHLRSPNFAIEVVDPTMSVNITVVASRSENGPTFTPAC